MAKYSAPDNLWTLLQTNSTRGLAVKLGVDRRTIQRWKNQGQQPIPKNEKLLAHEAGRDRTAARSIARSRYQHTPYKRLAVQLPTLRGYVGEEVTADEFVKLKARSKAEPRFRFDTFKIAKDKRGKKHYFRYQPSGTFQYDVQRARLADVASAMFAHRGENRSFSISYQITVPYQLADGTSIEKGTRSALSYRLLDVPSFDSPQKILAFLNHESAGRRFLTLRLTDTNG